jgi:hypothetical protein
MFAQVLPKLLPDVHDVDVRVWRAVGAVRALVRETACAIGGHDYLLHAAGNRICLRCADCGHETPGWRIDTTARSARRSDRGAAPRLIH